MTMRSKFNVSGDLSNRTCDGIVFDSALEMQYYRDVVLPGVQRGEILRWERQKKYILQDKFKHGDKTVLPIDYKADFFIVYSNGRERVIDIKGCPDATAKLKRKMFWYRYPNVDYVWIGHSKPDGGWVTYETIQEGRRLRKKMKRNSKGEKENG